MEPRGVGPSEPLVVSRHFLAAQNPEQSLWDVNNEMFWFGDFLMGLLVKKKTLVLVVLRISEFGNIFFKLDEEMKK